VLRAEGFVDVGRALHIGKQVARGMIAAHDADVIHRDLKPDNILLTQRGDDSDFVRLLDFGIAKIRHGDGHRAGAILGTPGYMSPEQAEGRDVDERTDVYSLGVVLYEMLSGNAPFTSRTAIGLLTQHICFEPRSMRSLPGMAQAVSEQLDAVVLKCLSKRVEDRYEGMRDLLQTLDELERAPSAPPKSMIIRYVSKIPLLRKLAAS
jgi:serine/threonine-protein kinase